jgi:hypothetical protein
MLARFDRSHQRVTGTKEMPAGMLVLRRIATSHVAALQAHSQVDPIVATLHAIFANVDVRVRHSNRLQMCTLGRHFCPGVKRCEAQSCRERIPDSGARALLQLVRGSRERQWEHAGELLLPHGSAVRIPLVPLLRRRQ